MNALRYHILSFLLVVAATTNASAQYVWEITHADKDANTVNYTPLLLDCSGPHCTAVLQADLHYVFSRSDDGGLSWHEQWRAPVPTGPVPPGFRYFYAMQQIDSANVVIVGDSGHIFRTFDAGATWSKQVAPEPYQNGSLWGVHFHDPMNGIVGLGDRPMTTSDGGLHWALGPLVGGFLDQNCHCFGPARFAIFCEQTSRVYHTNDNWATFDSTSPIADTSVHHPTLRRSRWNDGDTILAFGYSNNNGDVEALVLRSADGGRSWTKSSIPLQTHSQNPSVTTMSKLSDDTLYAGGSFPGTLMVSTDNGRNWRFDTVIIPSELSTIENETSVARPAPGEILASMVYNSLSTSPGIIAHAYITQKSEVASYEGTVTVYPYPNPSTSSITFQIGDRRLSEINVLDILGRNVLNTAMPAEGAITIDISHLSNGMYYIQNGQERARFVKQ